MGPFSADAVRAAYDAVAADYARAFADDLAQLPLDREVLDLAVAAAPSGGWAIDLGCGPAPVAEHLAGRAGPQLGLDLSAAMLAVAGERDPGLGRVQGDLRRLPLRAGCCALAVAYYSLQHVARAELPGVLGEVRRVLREGGVLVVATHLGEGDVQVEDFLGHQVEPFAGALHGRDELLGLLSDAGFDVELERQRGPLPHEYDSQRAYLVARRVA